MFCSNCGQKNDDSANFCKNCGTKLSAPSTEILGEESEKKNFGDEVVEAVKAVDDEILTEKETKNDMNEREVLFIPEGHEFYYHPGENAYAECIKIDNDTYHFFCVDRLSHFYWKKQIVDRVDPNLKVGDGVWVNLKELMDPPKHAYKAYTTTSNLVYELKNFYKYRKMGDTIYAPIVETQQEYFTVLIGPSAQVRVFYNELPLYVNPAKIRKNKIRKFKIIDLKEKDNRITVKLLLDEEQFYQDKKNWNELPKSITDKSKVVVYPKSLEYIKESEDVCEALFGEVPPSVEALVLLLDEKYKDAYEKKQINIQVAKKVMYMDFDLGIRDKKGVPQSACFKKKYGDTWTLCLVGFASAECMFEKYVYIPNWQKLLNELSEMALGDEDWDYKGSGKEKKYILKQYLLFDFYKSWLDNLMVEEDGEALFNTGLVDSSYDDIYCYLKKNTCTNDFYNRAWEFGYFACRAKGTNGKKLMAKFARFPNAPSYVDVNRISDLYFNPEKELFCDYEHIIQDNLKRLPLEFLRSKLCYDSEMDKAISSYEKSQKEDDLKRIMFLVNKKDDRGDRFRRDLQNGLKDAVETARKYCKWNYKTAIPIYYPRNNSISLLLPLKLQTNSNSKVDVALVVERLQNGNYQGQTILTLAMAYQDARQICRPNSEWLTINNIIETNDDDDDEAITERLYKD